MNLRKARLKELNKKHKQEEDRLLKENYERLKNLTGGFARGGEVKIIKKRLSPPSTLPFLPAKIDPPPKIMKKKEYTGDLLDRELAAKEKYREMQSRIAPVGNKMGAQYLNDTDLADFKKGLLRRR